MSHGGARSVFVLSSSGARSINQVSAVGRKIEDLGGRKIQSDWFVECKRGTPAGPSRSLLTTVKTSLSDQLFLVSTDAVAAAEDDLFAVLTKMQVSLELKLAHRLEGVQYKLGDFVMSVASGLERAGQDCCVLDIEYAPLSSLAQASALLNDFASSFIRSLGDAGGKGAFTSDPVDCPYQDYGLGDGYTLRHLAAQYARLP